MQKLNGLNAVGVALLVCVPLMGCNGGGSEDTADPDDPTDTGIVDDDTDGGTDVPDDLTWTATDLAAPAFPSWTSSYVAGPDAIWITGGGGLHEFDGTGWTLISDQGEFGFDPQNGNFALFMDPVLVGGASATEILVVSSNALLASYDGASFTKLVDGFDGPDVNANMPLQGDRAIWVSPAGNLYHLSQATDYDFVSWDGSTRSTVKLDTEVGNLDYPVSTVWGIDDDHIWVGGKLTSLFDSPVHHWDGSTWTRKTFSAMDEGRVVGFWGTAADDVWMITTGATNGSMIYRDTGNGWEGPGHFPGSGGSDVTYTDIWGTSNSNLFVGSNEGLFRFDGTEWTQVDIGGDEGVVRIHGLSATRLVVEVGTPMNRSFRLIEGN